MTTLKTRILSTVLISIATILASCEKEPGEGGLATIQGKVWGRDLDNDGFVKTQGYLGGVRVYIGVDDGARSDYFETVRTSYDGTYTFPFLRKGDYRVWVFSRCDTCVLEDTVRLQTATIRERKQTVTLPDMTVEF
jgi:hypothetical protein